MTFLKFVSASIFVQEFLDVEQNDFDDCESLEAEDGWSRSKLVGVTSCASYCDIVYADVFEMNMKHDFQIHDVLSIVGEVAFENVQGIAEMKLNFHNRIKC